MKLIRNIKEWGLSVLTLACISTSCDYLDVVPPEQPNLPDATSTYDRALGFLGSCYAGIKSTDVPATNYLHEFNASTDEYMLPYRWTEGSWQAYAFNTASATNQDWIWGTTYKYVGQCLLFLRELEGVDYSLVPEETQKLWRAECKFLIAYYHFATLRSYGPIPITDSYIAMDAPMSAYNGRYHFDYCVDWIAKQLDEAAEILPPVREKTDEWGRATSAMAKALKARLLLYAASPLWNGEFPYPTWKNTNFETPGYGYELVSKSYDPNKWEKALKACLEALELSEGAGKRSLYKVMDYNETKQVALPYVPGISDNSEMTEEEKKTFLQHVMKMRYLVTTDEREGNNEIIWGRWDVTLEGNLHARLPLRLVKTSNGTWWTGYSGVAPTLYTVEHFYTSNGKLPAKDPNYTNENLWFQKSAYRHSFQSADGANKTLDIANLNVGREPRFYAWLAFDGGDYATRLRDGQPLTLEMRNENLHGYNPSLFNRDHSVTGYLTQKFINPSIEFNISGSGSWGAVTPYIVIRLAELYLNVAECYAAKGDVGNALTYLNPIRERAGIPALTAADITSEMTIMDWVRNERFVELWNEGHRFFDVRRWKKGDEYFGEGKRQGLNGAVQNPTWDEFYQRTTPTHPYVWTNRMYLNPVFYNEVYKNPQMVQAPEY